MATSSIYANIVIDSEEKARALLDALESSKEAVLRRKREGQTGKTTVTEMTDDEIRRLAF